ncbi:protein YIPF5, putative [Entamoeba invadens IP1]|uniref:Protein YIPF5, putative n=1 Tax=Entamoeba invadens IP1 TaxID=370355 RepID=A0A0A1UA27_ENTIV|nr:protein YIPF5, putative [Entamoeba invadens IP1]ELP91835.1 protein YIPF5, putative [Entamoeba invadens IP1]|eukprot:XP_004258606.1 protein YIPF5, putative [Entamoeba invadens IP1]
MNKEDATFSIEMDDDGNDADDFLKHASQVGETAFLEDEPPKSGKNEGELPKDEKPQNLTGEATLTSTTETKQESTQPEKIEDELPLLEELGIDFSKMGKTMLRNLNPFSTAEQLESDILGSILISFLLGVVIALNGKLRFGDVYGFSILAVFVEYLFLNFMSQKNIEYFLVFTHFAYNLVPMIVFGLFTAVFDLFIAIPNSVLITAVILCISLSTYMTARCTITTLEAKGNAVLLVYPIILYYTLFMLLVMF